MPLRSLFILVRKAFESCAEAQHSKTLRELPARFIWVTFRKPEGVLMRHIDMNCWRLGTFSDRHQSMEHNHGDAWIKRDVQTMWPANSHRLHENGIRPKLQPLGYRSLLRLKILANGTLLRERDKRRRIRLQPVEQISVAAWEELAFEVPIRSRLDL